MVRLGPLTAVAADPRCLGNPVAMVALVLVATAAVAAFGCAKGAKKPRRDKANNVYYYGQGYAPPPPAGAYGYPAQQQPADGYPCPSNAGKKQGHSGLGAGAGLTVGAVASLAGGVIIGSTITSSSGCGGGWGGGCGA